MRALAHTPVMIRIRRGAPFQPLLHRVVLPFPGTRVLWLLLSLLFPPVAWSVAAAQVELPVLEFLEPTNGAVFSLGQEIPIVLRGFAPEDVIGSAEVAADGRSLGTAVFCCPLCPCARPLPGMPLILQIPVPWEAGRPPGRTWQGWTNAALGTRHLTASGTGEGGTVVVAKPVTLRVLDLRLGIAPAAAGGYQFVIPDGSLVDGGFDMEASDDLRTWRRLGSFSPGNVAAFYVDVPPEGTGRRFYRAVQAPPPPGR